MRTPVKLTAYGGALAVVFAGALGVGGAIGSPVIPVPGHGAGMHAGAGSAPGGGGAGGGGHGGGHGAGNGGGGGVPMASAGGLQVADRGYQLELAAPQARVGTGVPTSFRIVGADGAPVAAFEVCHDKQMHLIAVRRDTMGFQHVHPTMDAAGTWTAPLDLTAGQWWLFADFVPAEGAAAGRPVTLGGDVAVAGDYRPAPLPAVSRAGQVDDYAVTLAGDLRAGQETPLTLSVSRAGQPVTDLQPYLGAFGHLVALRAGDLAYLHVHPEGEPGDGRTRPGPDITFSATAPSAGQYRLFLDFQHQGVVRTAEFTVAATGTGDAAGAGAGGGGVPPAPMGSMNPGGAGQDAGGRSADHGGDGHSH